MSSRSALIRPRPLGADIAYMTVEVDGACQIRVLAVVAAT
jgi:hypothetical protein